MKRTSLLGLPVAHLAMAAAVTFTLAACTPAPSGEDVAERFRIEIEAATDGLLAQDNPEVVGLSEDVADDLLDGGCTIDPGLGLDEDENEAYIYAVSATCLMYFEHEMSEAQIDRAKVRLLEQATE
ncbi:hypothetical protein [Agromyces arachidis]|uniref:hypothetical protein n=1 Tax=Agromyces arachidis TaxID=766966 RepID=UPI0040577BC8